MFDNDDPVTGSRGPLERPTPPLGSLTGHEGDRHSHRSVDDGLFQGIRNEPPPELAGYRRRGAGPGTWLLVLLLLGGGGAGAYYYWQSRPAAEVTSQATPFEAVQAVPEGDTAAAEGDEQASETADDEVKALLEAGRELAENDDYTGAGAKFTAALQLDPGSTEASALLRETVETLAKRAEEAISQGQFQRANEHLSSAVALAPAREDLSKRQSELPGLETEWRRQQEQTEQRQQQAQQRKDQLAAGQQLLAGKDFTGAAEHYQSLLAQNPGDSEAAEGLSKSVDGLVSRAQSDAEQHQFDQAAETLDAALGYLPDHAEATSLQQKLPELEQAWKEEQAAIAQRKREQEAALARREADANQRANNVVRAMNDGNLSAALQVYQSLRRDYPKMEVTGDVKRRLLSAYTSAARSEVQAGAYPEALELIEGGQALAPDLTLWAELREQIDLEADRPRRLGAY